ncbi:immunoglobulin superfamily member 6 [Centropristis striata]|uniref:immunoglobulin superfamily member 6 n=1 Tax=Centropristis striata TaxID=184440 RepID=UPI0027E0DC59|nr:immunoglobulin superfamily member 6 [Centropristis striata]
MDPLLWLSLLLTYLPLTESMKKEESCLSQQNVIWRKIGTSVNLKCDVSQDCSAAGLHYEWFTFNENSHFPLNVDSNPLKYRLEGGSLSIRSLQSNDSGIYHCAAASRGAPAAGSQHVGLGTTLIVKEQVRTTVRFNLLWVSFVLLAIYSVAVVTLFIKKFCCNKSAGRRTNKTGKKNSTKKAQFRDVLHEMYNRRNMDRGSKTGSRNHREETASNDFNSSNDDIYQNV